MISNKSYTINIFCKYLVYFNKYSNLIGPNILPSLYGQNLLDIACRSIIGIFLYPTCPDGTSVSSYVSKDTIQTITPGYFGNGDLVGTSLDSPQTNIQSPKKKKRAKDGVRFAISGGYSSRLGKLAEGATSSYRHGFTINGDLAGFFNDYIGLGAFANYRQYSETDVSSWIMGPKLLIRFYNRSKNSALILGVGLGYTTYKGQVWTSRLNTATGGSFGSTTEIGYEIGISKAAALMFNLNVSTATIGTLKAGGKTYDLEHRESLNAINLIIGIVFGR